MLRGALDGDSLTVTKALADNARLWSAVMDAMRHPDNMLPRPLRAAIISVGAAVQRVGDDDPPDFGFLIGINEQVAAGLAGL